MLRNHVLMETENHRYRNIANILKQMGIGTQKEATFLDIGSSTGAALKCLDEKEFPKLKIIALDKISPDEVKTYYNVQNQNNVEFVKGDATQLPFADNSVNVACLAHILMHMNEQAAKASLKEAFRVLKPDGYLFVQGLKEKSRLRGEMLHKKDEHTFEEILSYENSWSDQEQSMNDNL